MNISLDKELKDFADSVVRSGMYSSHSEFVRDMIRRQKAVAMVDAMILEGLQSPSLSQKESDAFFKKLKQGRI